MSSDTVLEQVDELARDILDQARNSLMTTFRFLDVALWRMPYRSAHIESALACDGYCLYYNALETVMRFRQSPEEITRDFLHCILHCVYRHQFDGKHKDTAA